MPQQDLLHRYIFEDLHVRGELVQLQQSIDDVLSGHDYPAPVQTLLAELMVATSLLTATLKFEGDIAVQLQGDGPIRYAVINGNHQQEMRGIARLQSEVHGTGMQSLLGKGVMVITITPNVGEPYQGVVPLTEPTLAGCLEMYFKQSEQLDTRMWIEADVTGDKAKAAGMLLQVLPVEQEKSRQDFLHLEALTDTVKREELLELDSITLLTRLYHQDNPQLFEPQAIKFVCGCSREKSESAVINLGPAEINDIIEEQGSLSIKCEYCNTEYKFSQTELEALAHVQ